MFAKRLFQKAAHRHHQHHEKGQLMSDELNFRINVHYGIPYTASILAFDPIQRLLAIGTLDGRIKVIGGDNIEGILISPKLLPFKYLEFLQNQGLLISITNNNDIQIWNLESRTITCTLQLESNVTAFSVISGSSFMFVGDENGLISVLKYDPDTEQLLQMPYHLPSDSLAEAAGFLISTDHPIVGVLPQPCTSGSRLLIAYASGLIILWDFVEADIVVVQGNKVLQLKNEVVSDVDETSPHDIEEKEITALCWASVDGSILAVGDIDGDILFWKTSKASSMKNQHAGSSQNVVKLQLSSAEKRLPVIVLHWIEDTKSRKNAGGQLFVYGGEDIGCEEVVTVLCLEWTSGMEAVKCIARVDLTLTGSFADMILVPSAGTTRNDENSSLFVLSNPGRIHFYDSSRLSSEVQQGSEPSISAINFPYCIPTDDPLMTVAKIFNIRGSMEGGSEMVGMSSTLTSPRNKKWPLTGGVSNNQLLGKDNKVYRVYVAGYRNGLVRIWDATYPVFSLLCILTTEGVRETESRSSISTINLCSSTLRLAIGSDCGLVQIYNLCSSEETSFRFVTDTKTEVRALPQCQGPRCAAVFDVHKSRVQALEFTENGSKLVVVYEPSRIAVFDVQGSSIAFITDCVPISTSPVMSVLSKSYVHDTTKNSNELSTNVQDNRIENCIFMLTKDASIYVIDGSNGSMISSNPTILKKPSSAIYFYVIESHTEVSISANDQPPPKDDKVREELAKNVTDEGSEKPETNDPTLERNSSVRSLKELFVLLCCKDSIRVYPAKAVVQGGESKSIYKAELSKPCCWASVLMKYEKVCGLILFYQTGELEIRSLPDLELVKEYPLMSDLRWNFRVNMERMISSTENGHITLANGSEVAFISLLEGENDFSIPDALPSLHDEVLASAASAALKANSDPMKKQGVNAGILSGIIKGFKEPKPNKSINLEDIFMTNPFPDPTDEQGHIELTLDDIEIDEPVPLPSTSSSQEVHNKNKDTKSERERLFGGVDDTPKVRTKEEIIAKYRKTGDASSAAAEAKNKLMERGEKLDRISRRTEDLKNGAEDFASLASELAKAMEKRKWYHI